MPHINTSFSSFGGIDPFDLSTRLLPFESETDPTDSATSPSDLPGFSPLKPTADRDPRLKKGDRYEPSSSDPTQKTAEEKGATGKDAKEPGKLTDEEKKMVSELAKRDTHVRSHEAAHMGAGGAYVKGGPSFTYQRAPNGQRYAIGGEVQIDTSPIKGDPKATITKMQQVRAAAMAPSDPSGADQAVAAAATQAMSAAQAELAKNSLAAGQKGEPTSSTGSLKTDLPPKPSPAYRQNGHFSTQSTGTQLNITA